MPPLLLGDLAYLLLPSLMKENNCVDTKHVIFNNKLTAARNQIECAFGRLKCHWRI